jgi:hypothetical protein
MNEMDLALMDFRKADMKYMDTELLSERSRIK